MKKNLPNIILLALFAGGSGLVVFLYKSFGLGLFLKSFGIFIIVTGILVFIFFLSIDPGYAWSKNVNLNANYIAISAAVIVFIVGVMLVFLGRKIHVATIHEEKEIARCRDILNGNVGDVIDSEWYFLSDRVDDGNLVLYLFQKKGEIKNFKFIAIESITGNRGSVREIKVSSAFYENLVVVRARDGVCAGIFEGDLITRRPENSDGDLNTSFDVQVAYYEKGRKEGEEQREFKLAYQKENIYCY